MGFQKPTKIQAEAIPVVISGRHAYPFIRDLFLFSLHLNLIINSIHITLF
jgi:hypothetical protein